MSLEYFHFGNTPIRPMLVGPSGSDLTREVIPLATGVAFAATPYAVGAALVALGPHPAIKAAGVSMMIPTGVGEAFWFAVGYGVGTQIVDHIPPWVVKD